MRILLFEEGLDIEGIDDEKYRFIISAANGELEFENIRNWIIKNLKN